MINFNFTFSFFLQSEELPMNDLGQKVKAQESLITSGATHQLKYAQRQPQQQQGEPQHIYPAPHRPPVGGVQIYPPGVVSYFNNL